MMGIEYCLVNLLDHTNMPYFHQSVLYGNTSPKKKDLKMCVLFFRKIEYH